MSKLSTDYSDCKVTNEPATVESSESRSGSPSIVWIFAATILTFAATTVIDLDLGTAGIAFVASFWGVLFSVISAQKQEELPADSCGDV